jgi:TatD DNase family protein
VKRLPPLDMHAHVAASISNHGLESLGAVIFIATRSLQEYSRVSRRNDLTAIWGAGCHPGLVGAHRDFNSESFREAIRTTAYVAEVGLDGSSRVAMDVQVRTLRSILRLVQDNPRVVSLHSYRATGKLLELLSEQKVSPGFVLHWWLGDDNETKTAINLGCSFSVNYSIIRSTQSWRLIPLDRLLLETDHPSGDRFSPPPRQPGSVQEVERVLAKHHAITPEELRSQIWRNLARIISATNTHQLLPVPVKNMLDYISSSR